MWSTPKDIENPVLELHDKYFGGYWKKMTEDEREWKLNLINGRPDDNMFQHKISDICLYIMEHRQELDAVEAKLEELTGKPPFPISPYPTRADDFLDDLASDDDDYFQRKDKEREEIPRMVSKHYSAWIRKTLDALDTQSHFSKLPLELKDIILEFAIEDVAQDWESSGTKWKMLTFIELRRMHWDELVESRKKDRVWDLVMLAELLYERWIQLRKALVAKYEVNEETEKEWQLIQKARKPLY